LIKIIIYHSTKNKKKEKKKKKEKNDQLDQLDLPDELIERLIQKDNQLNSDDLHNLSRSQIVHKAFEYDVIDENEFIAFIPSDNYVVKSYLWSYLHNPIHRQKAP